MARNTCIPKEIAVKLKQQFRSKEKFTDQELRDKIGNLLREKYATNISVKEGKEIVELAANFKKAKDKLSDNMGSINHEKEIIEYALAENKINEYLKALDPSSNIAVLTGTIGRGAMLASVKSPVLNIGSNIENSAVEAFSRRISSGQFKRSNEDVIKKYIGMANRVYDQTGWDISRMSDLGDVGIGGQAVLGKDTISAVGKGPVRKIGQWVSDKIFNKLMGKPDSVTANINFADSVSLGATKAAKGNAKIARGIMEDAMLINPKTETGKIIRAQGVLDAQISTYTQRTWAASISEGLRDILNRSTGDVRLGDWLMPFVKTPANVIATGADYAGLGAFKATYKLIDGLRKGTLKEPGVIRSMVSDATRAGVGLTTAFVMSRFFENEDFVGAYDPKRTQIEQLKNSNYNAFKVGDKWVSVEWLGPLAVPFTAMMYAKKVEGLDNKALRFSKGVLNQIAELPGLDVVVDTVSGMSSTKESTLGDVSKDIAKSSIDQIASRLIPGGIIDIAKMTDDYQRDTKGGIFNTTLSKIPGARQTLPIKTNVFGQQMKDETALWNLFFGSRVKTDAKNPVIDEVNKVTLKLKKGSTFTDWSRSTSKELLQFKEVVGEERFAEAKIKYGKELEKQLNTLFKSPSYNLMSDEEKLRQINSQDTQAQELILKQYGFKYKQDKTKKKPIL